MNDKAFFIIDAVIVLLVFILMTMHIVQIKILRQIERNTRKPHFSSECCRDEREKP